MIRVTVGQVRHHRALLTDNGEEMAARTNLARVNASIDALREREVDAHVVCTLAA